VKWLKADFIRAAHRILLKEFGGALGEADEQTLDSTLARPINLSHYEPDASIFQLAAAYGYGFARNHAFADGNKRVALAAIDTFLDINGYEFKPQEAQAIVFIESLAMGELSEDELAAWIEGNSVKK